MALTVQEALSKAITFKTIANRQNSNKDEFDGLFNYFKSVFPLSFNSENTKRFNNAFLLKINGSLNQDKPVLLMAHQDVVDVFGKWENPPFSGKITSDAVWGRGAVDTKGSLCAILTALEKLLESGVKPKNDLYVLSTANEEFSGEDGAAVAEYFKNSGVSFSITLDEGGAIMENPIAGVKGKFGMIALSERASVKMVVFGEGKLAPTQMSRFVLKMQKSKLEKAYFSLEVLEMFKNLTPSMTGGMKFIFKNLWLTKPLLKRVLPRLSDEAKAMVMPTISFSNFEQSEKEKSEEIIPRNAFSVCLTINHTYCSEQKSLIEKTEKLAQKFGLKTKIIYSRAAVKAEKIKSSGYNTIASTLLESFSDVTPCPFILFGGTDSRHFVDISESVLRFAPIYLSSSQFGSFHKTNENIFISSLCNAETFYYNLIKKL